MIEIDELLVQRPHFLLRIRGLTLSSRRLTVIGPSGGGKSTLLRTLLGLEPNAQVRGLRCNKVELANLPPHRRPFAWMPQELGLWPHLSARQHVAFARTRGRDLRANEIDLALLRRLGIEHRAEARPGQMSGGERQRLAFARVLAIRPACAALDEPFSPTTLSVPF